MKLKKIIAGILVAALGRAICPAYALAEDIEVYITISNKGELAQAADGTAMANRKVTVSDENADGIITFDEALIAAHKAYNSENGYSAPGGYVGRLWGKDTYNTLFFVNHESLQNSVSQESVSDGDYLVASINADDTYYADWYSFFGFQEKTVITDEEFTLTLKGHLGMAFTDEDKVNCGLSNMLIGIWNNGEFNTIKTTDADGNAVLSFSAPGIYILSAEGMVKSTVADWSAPPYDGSATVEADCPIIAPVCIVTVQEDLPSVESYLPAPGQFVNLPAYANPNATLSDSGEVTLGAFGGNIVYRYDTPIENDAKNPYGIDFIVFGNAFANSDGTTAVASGEPAAVMVSENGEDWYELAGSEYYDASTAHNVTVTYKNSDKSFAGAKDIPWTDNFGNGGVVKANGYHTQAYFPNPKIYSDYQNGKGKNSSYTEEMLSFTGTKISGEVYPPFGYADIHAAGENKNIAENPYAKKHYSVYNGDGFDLDWAVDYDGNSVKLERVSYIKIYNPCLADGGATGERSPEIVRVIRAKSDSEAVGRTSELTSLSINGKNLSLETDKYIYDFDGDGADFLSVTPVAKNSHANIYVGNQRVLSGESTQKTAAVDKLRIIVQEGKKEPLIYIVNVSDIKSGKSNAELKSLKLTPGDDLKMPNQNGEISFETANNVEFVRFTPEMLSKTAIGVVSGENITDIEVANGEESAAIPLKIGENKFVFTVTSSDKTQTKSYKITVIRAENGSASTPQRTIQVEFTLTGDTNHYNKANGTYTGKHSEISLIKTQKVTVPKDSTVKYLTELMLNNSGIDYISDGVYISEINGLAEFDNGPNSGWMYMYNGKIAEEGYADKVLSDGDVIKWFFTDDYTAETEYEKTEHKASSGGGTVVSSSDGGQKCEITNKKAYPDIIGHWGEKSIEFVINRGLFVGTDKGFEPDANLTRAMFVTTLFRLENASSVGKNPFIDVAADEWYTDAVIWANENGVVYGVSEKEFEPYSLITREQLCAMIYRYANFIGINTAVCGSLEGFSDSAKVSDWAAEAIAWAVENKLICGRADGMLDAKGLATRAESAAIYQRFIENLLGR